MEEFILDNTLNTEPWRCPKCHEALMKAKNEWKCSEGHCFDIAKEGYVNLILANQKQSAESGDGKEMILARDRVMNKGVYQELLKVIFESIENLKTKNTILEIGCGSGFYINEIAKHFEKSRCYGTDISKEAIKFSAKKYRKSTFAVANSYLLPIGDRTFDVILSIFSPIKEEEIQRILRPGGVFISVRPGENHWQELKNNWPNQEKTKIQASLEQLKTLNTLKLTKTIDCDHQLIQDLIEMSPLKWKMREEDKQTLNQTQLTFIFVINLYTT